MNKNIVSKNRINRRKALHVRVLTTFDCEVPTKKQLFTKSDHQRHHNFVLAELAVKLESFCRFISFIINYQGFIDIRLRR